VQGGGNDRGQENLTKRTTEIDWRNITALKGDNRRRMAKRKASLASVISDRRERRGKLT